MRICRILSLAIVLTLSVPGAFAETFTDFDGSGFWSHAQNWSGGHVPGSADDVLFDGSCTASCTIDTDVTVASITVSSAYTGTLSQAADVTTLGGILLNGGRWMAHSQTITVDGGLRIASIPGIFDAGSGSVILNGSSILVNSSNPFAVLDIAAGQTTSMQSDVTVTQLCTVQGQLVFTNWVTLHLRGSGSMLNVLGSLNAISPNRGVVSYDAVGSQPVVVAGGNYGWCQLALNSIEGANGIFLQAGDIAAIDSMLTRADSTSGSVEWDTNGFNVTSSSWLALGDFGTSVGGTLMHAGASHITVPALCWITTSSDQVFLEQSTWDVGEWAVWNEGAMVNPGTSTVEITNGMGPFWTTVPHDFYNLSITGPCPLYGPVTVSHDLSIATQGVLTTENMAVDIGHDLTVLNGGRLMAGNSAISIGADLSINAGASFAAGTSQVSVIGPGSISDANQANAFYDLNAAGPGATVQLNSDITTTHLCDVLAGILDFHNGQGATLHLQGSGQVLKNSGTIWAGFPQGGSIRYENSSSTMPMYITGTSYGWASLQLVSIAGAQSAFVQQGDMLNTDDVLTSVDTAGGTCHWTTNSFEVDTSSWMSIGDWGASLGGTTMDCGTSHVQVPTIAWFTNPNDIINLQQSIWNVGLWGAWNESAEIIPGQSTVIASNDLGVFWTSIPQSFFNLVINAPGGSATAEGSIQVAGNLTINAGALAANNNQITVNGDIAVAPEATLSASSELLELTGTGNQTFQSSQSSSIGQFLADGGERIVTLTTGLDAGSFAVGAGTTVDIGAQAVVTTNILSLIGSANHPITLKSDHVGSPWFLDLLAGGTQNIQYVAAQDSNASAGLEINDSNTGTDHGDNLHWLFSNPNPPPTFSLTPSLTVNENAAPQSDANFAVLISPPGDQVTYVVTSTPTALFLVQPAIDAFGTLTYSVNPNQFGTATLTVQAYSLGNPIPSAAQSAVLNILFVNQAPSFTKGGNQMAPNNGGQQNVLTWATAISPGPANEANQTVSFSVTTPSGSLFSVQPFIAPNGTLTYTPAVGQSGTATVTVVIHDSGGTANGGQDSSLPQAFLITISPSVVFPPPSFVIGTNQVAAQGSGQQTVVNWITAITPVHAGVSFLITTDTPSLFLIQPQIGATGTLIYVPTATSSGIATVTVVAQQTIGTTVVSSAPQTATLTINPSIALPVIAIDVSLSTAQQIIVDVSHPNGSSITVTFQISGAITTSGRMLIPATASTGSISIPNSTIPDATGNITVTLTGSLGATLGTPKSISVIAPSGNIGGTVGGAGANASNDSFTSPAFLTYIPTALGNQVTITGNGVTAQIQSIGTEMLGANIALSQTAPTSVAITDTIATTTSATTIRQITWKAIDLNGETQYDQIVIRAGDSLLVRVSGVSGYTSVYPQGTHGQKLILQSGAMIPINYSMQGSYLMSAYDSNRTLLGSIQVVAVGNPFSGVTASYPCEINYQRTINFAPPSSFNTIPYVKFAAVDPIDLKMDPETGSTTFSVMPLVVPSRMGEPMVGAFVDGTSTLISVYPITAFTIERRFKTIGAIVASSASGHPTVVISQPSQTVHVRPFVPHLRLTLSGSESVHSKTSALSQVWNSDAIPPFVDSKTQQLVGVYAFNIGCLMQGDTFSASITAADAEANNLQVSDDSSSAALMHAMSLTWSPTMPPLPTDGVPLAFTLAYTPNLSANGSNGDFGELWLNSLVPLIDANGNPVTSVSINTALITRLVLPVLTTTQNFGEQGASVWYQDYTDYSVSNTGVFTAVDPVSKGTYNTITPTATTDINSALASVPPVFVPDKNNANADVNILLLPTESPDTNHLSGISGSGAGAGAGGFPTNPANPGYTRVVLEETGASIGIGDIPDDWGVPSVPNASGYLLTAQLGQHLNLLTTPSQRYNLGMFGPRLGFQYFGFGFSADFMSELPTFQGKFLDDIINGFYGLGQTAKAPTFVSTGALKQVGVYPILYAGGTVGDDVVGGMPIINSPFFMFAPAAFKDLPFLNYASFIGISIGSQPAYPFFFLRVGNDLPYRLVVDGTAAGITNGLGGGNSLSITTDQMSPTISYDQTLLQIDYQGARQNGTLTVQGKPSDEILTDSEFFPMTSPPVPQGLHTGLYSLNKPAEIAPFSKDGIFPLRSQGKVVGQVNTINVGLGQPDEASAVVTVIPATGWADLGRGNLYLRFPIAQFVTPRLGPSCTLSYNSRDGMQTALGYGWRTNYDMKIINSTIFIDESGRRLQLASGGPEGITGAKLTSRDSSVPVDQADPAHGWMAHEEYRISRPQGEWLFFDDQGRFVRETTLRGDTICVSLDASSGFPTSAFEADNQGNPLVGGRRISLAAADLGSDGSAISQLNVGRSGSWSFIYDNYHNIISISSNDINGILTPITWGIAYDSNVNEINGITAVTLPAVQDYPKAKIMIAPPTIGDKSESITVTYGTGGGTTYIIPGSKITYPPPGDSAETPPPSTAPTITYMSCVAGGEVSSVQDSRPNPQITTAYTYQNPMYRQISSIATDTNFESRIYDSFGHVISRTVLGSKSPAPLGATATPDQKRIWTFGGISDNTHTLLWPNDVVLLQSDSVQGVTGVNIPSGASDLTTLYTYGSDNGNLGQVTATVDPCGRTTHLIYSSQGFVTSSDASGVQLIFDNDSMGRPTTITYPTDDQEKLGYVDGNFGLTSLSTIDLDGYQTDTQYDSLGRTSSRVTSQSDSVNYSYDQLNNIIETTSAGDGVSITDFSYRDGWGRVTQLAREDNAGLYLVDPTIIFYIPGPGNAGWIANSVRDGTCNLGKTVVDASGRTIQSSVYHAITPLDTEECKTTYAYDDMGNLISQTDAEGKTTQFSYDGMAHILLTTRPNQGKIASAYNAVGWILAQSDADQLVTSFSFDACGRMLSTISPSGAISYTGYDPLGRMSLVQSGGAAAELLAYDGDNRLLSRSEPTGEIFVYDYISLDRDARDQEMVASLPLEDGNLSATQVTILTTDGTPPEVDTTFMDARRRTVRRESFSSAGSAFISTGESWVFPDDLTTDHFVPGRAVVETTALSPAAPTRATSPTWMALDGSGGRVEDLTSQTIPDSKFGGALSISNPFGLISTATHDPVSGDVMSLDDNHIGNITAQKAVSTITLRDHRGLVLNSSNALGEISIFSYDPSGRIQTSTTPAGIKTTITYTNSGSGDRILNVMRGSRLTTYTFDSGGQPSSSSIGNVIDWNVLRDPFGREILRQQNGTSIQSSYDSQTGYLLSQQQGPVLTSFTYTQRGLITSKVTGAQAVSYSYDGLGRVTSTTFPDLRSQTLMYDAAGDVLTTSDFNAVHALMRTTETNRQLDTGTITGTTIISVLGTENTSTGMGMRQGGGTVQQNSADLFGSGTTLTSSVISRSVDVGGREVSFQNDSAAPITSDYNDDDTIRDHGTSSSNSSYQYTNGFVTTITKNSIATQLLYDQNSNSTNANGDLVTLRSLYGSETRAFDLAGHLSSITKNITGMPSVVDSVIRDSFGRVTSLVSPDGTSSFCFDEATGWLASERTPTSIASYLYSQNGDRTSEQSQIVDRSDEDFSLGKLPDGPLPNSITAKSGEWQIFKGQVQSMVTSSTNPAQAFIATGVSIVNCNSQIFGLSSLADGAGITLGIASGQYEMQMSCQAVPSGGSGLFLQLLWAPNDGTPLVVMRSSTSIPIPAPGEYVIFLILLSRLIIR